MSARLPGDPTVWQRLRYVAGQTLPPKHRDWVKHDLTDAGWQLRLLGGIAVLLTPFAIACLFLPGIDALSRVLLILLLYVGMTITIGPAAQQIRNRRLQRHGLPVPRDPDEEWRQRHSGY